MRQQYQKLFSFFSFLFFLSFKRHIYVMSFVYIVVVCMRETATALVLSISLFVSQALHRHSFESSVSVQENPQRKENKKQSKFLKWSDFILKGYAKNAVTATSSMTRMTWYDSFFSKILCYKDIVSFIRRKVR